MKKITSLLIYFLLFTFASLDSENIELNLDRFEDEIIEINWFVKYDEFDYIFLDIKHNNSVESYRLPSKKGSIELCCYPNEIVATITVQITKAVKLSDEDCDAVECFNFVKEEYFTTETLAAKLQTPTTTTAIPTATTTSTTTTTTIPPPVKEEISFLNIEITNALITTIPLFDDVDFTDIEKNNIAIILTTIIIVLFYVVLLLQEWFNRVISTKSFKFFSTDKEIRSKGKFRKFVSILFVLISTSFLIGYVEEGASLKLEIENLAIFLAAFVGLFTATFFYEGVEGIIESRLYKQKVTYNWAPQAIVFALFSTFSFIYFQMPVGFIFGFIASSYVISKRNKAKLSPKFYSSISLMSVGFGFFYLTSIPLISNSSVLSAVAALTYLMCLEGVIFKSLPGGGNELSESLKDSKGLFKIFPIMSFLIGIWLFIRILIIPPDSELANFQQELLSMGSFTLTFAFILLGYIFVILILGYLIKFFGKSKQSY